MDKRRGERKRSPPSLVGNVPQNIRIVREETIFSYRGKKRKSYHHKLTPQQQRYVVQEAAVRDFIKTERQKGNVISWKDAQQDPKFVSAIEVLQKFSKMKHKTQAAKAAATQALKVLGRISKYYRGIYF